MRDTGILFKELNTSRIALLLARFCQKLLAVAKKSWLECWSYGCPGLSFSRSILFQLFFFSPTQMKEHWDPSRCLLVKSISFVSASECSMWLAIYLFLPAPLAQSSAGAEITKTCHHFWRRLFHFSLISRSSQILAGQRLSTLLVHSPPIFSFVFQLQLGHEKLLALPFSSGTFFFSSVVFISSHSRL